MDNQQQIQSQQTTPLVPPPGPSRPSHQPRLSNPEGDGRAMAPLYPHLARKGVHCQGVINAHQPSKAAAATMPNDAPKIPSNP